MRITTKGQVTVPKEVRNALGIQPGSEVAFLRQDDGSYKLVKLEPAGNQMRSPFRAARGAASVKMGTDEILALTRGEG